MCVLGYGGRGADDDGILYFMNMLQVVIFTLHMSSIQLDIVLTKSLNIVSNFICSSWMKIFALYAPV